MATTIATLYKLVLETTLRSGTVMRDTVHASLEKPLAETLAANLNASINAAATGDRRKVNSKVVVVPELGV